MPKIAEQVAIEASIHQVFEVCDNPNALPLCMPGAKAVSFIGWTEHRIGDSFLVTQGVMGKQYDQQFTYAEYEKPTKITWRFAGATVGTMRFALSPHAVGTQLSVFVDYEAQGGILRRLGDSLVFRRVNERNARRMLKQIKAMVEAPEN